MEHYPEVSCYFATVRKMLKGFNLVFVKGTLWKINLFVKTMLFRTFYWNSALFVSSDSSFFHFFVYHLIIQKKER